MPVLRGDRRLGQLGTEATRRRHPDRGEQAEGEQSASGAEQRRRPEPVGTGPLHGGDEEHTEPTLGSVPLAEHRTGEGRRCGQLQPVGHRRPRRRQLDRPHASEAARSEGFGDVVDRPRRGPEADRCRHEHEEEHGDRGNRHRAPVAPEHDQQARRDGDPRSGVGDGRQAHDEPAQRRHAGRDERRSEGQQSADGEPASGRPHGCARRAEVDVAAVADDRCEGVGGRHDHPARPAGATTPHPDGDDEREAGGRGRERPQGQRPNRPRSVLPVLHNQPPHIIVAHGRSRRSPARCWRT